MMPFLAIPPAAETPGTTDAAVDRWKGLESVLRARLVIASCALPVGILLRPEGVAGAWWLLGGALFALGVASALYGIGVSLKRGYATQVYLQLTGDLALVTALAVYTGGRGSQFVMFYALVAIAGGLLARVAGGLFAAGGGWAAILALPWLAARAGVPTGEVDSTLPGPALLFPFLGMVGILAGVLGDRVHRTRHDLEQTTRELDRVRLDNDAILRHLTSGVLTVDAHGRVAYLNPAAEQMLGLRTLATRGRPIAEALPERLASLRDHIGESLREARPRARAELQLHSAADQPLPVGISTSLLTHGGTVTGVVAVFQDLTEVREMERRARRNQTLAEVGALAAGIAHELRNGLKPISGSVEYLQRELKVEGEDAVLLGLIGTECNRLNRFVTDLLSYARERDLALETLDVGETLHELAQEVSRDPRRAPGIAVHLEPGPGPRAIRVDREQMRQVWLNLVTNALESMAGEGALTLRWRDTGGDSVAVEFEDEGSGVAAEDLPRVGQPFFTTKEGGTGLGVAIAQRIVERHGGTLQYESVSGRGTIARVTLACAESVEAGLAQAA
jgi:two-component system, NtrC family, sensor histidine kinase PilS